MKKLIIVEKLLIVALMLNVLLYVALGCDDAKNWEEFQLKTITVGDYSETEVTGDFFLLWGSYNEATNSGFRYIFLANNGIDGTWIINDIVDFRDDDRITVSIQYVESDSEQKLLRHVNTSPDNYDYSGYKAYYILYLTEENIINLLNNL